MSRSPQRKGDVGVVKDLAIHDIDIVNHLLKTKPEIVYATVGKIRHRYEDYANISIGYGNSHVAFVETNWLTPRRVRTLTVTGTEGIINVEYTTQQIQIENIDLVTQPILQCQEPLYAELFSFINCIRENREPIITGEDGLQALQICEAALKSAETRTIVSL